MNDRYIKIPCFDCVFYKSHPMQSDQPEWDECLEESDAFEDDGWSEDEYGDWQVCKKFRHFLD